MSGIKIRVPRVYAAINAVTAELALSGIAKLQVNEDDQYRFRGIDDVFQALAPLLASHRLCILPRVLERISVERTGSNRQRLIGACLKVAFDIVSVRDGSMHTIEVHGEALDAGDKATAKAMSAAYKQAMLQAFCIPVGQVDADSETHRIEGACDAHIDPVQGWEQWSCDICEMVAGCTTDDAVGRVQTTYAKQLRTLSKGHSDLFALVGKAIAERRSQIAGLSITSSPPCNTDSSGSINTAAQTRPDATVPPQRSRAQVAPRTIDRGARSKAAAAVADGAELGEPGYAKLHASHHQAIAQP